MSSRRFLRMRVVIFVAGNERLERVSACVCATNRAITVARDNAAQAGLRCRALEESLMKLVREREEMRTHLEAVRRERERGEIQTEEYVRKMAVHTESVSQAEEGGTAHQELARLQTKKQELEQKSRSSLPPSTQPPQLMQEWPTSLEGERVWRFSVARGGGSCWRASQQLRLDLVCWTKQ